MVSLRLISHSEEKIATFAQGRIDGAASECRANEVNNHEESLEAKANCFVINLKKSKIWPIILSPLAQKIADLLVIITLRQFWSRRVFFGTQALPKNRGHMLTTKIGIRQYRPV